MTDKEKPYYIPPENTNYIPDGVPYLQGFVPDHLGGTGDDKTLNDIRDAAVRIKENEATKSVEYGPYSTADIDDEPHERDLSVVDTDAKIAKAVGERVSDDSLTPSEYKKSVKEQGKDV